MSNEKYQQSAARTLPMIQREIERLAPCPDCSTELEFEYGEGFWFCTRCGFEHHPDDL